MEELRVGDHYQSYIEASSMRENGSSRHRFATGELEYVEA
jgi:hypothetical protein